jgi:hypothetical protein
MKEIKGITCQSSYFSDNKIQPQTDKSGPNQTLTQNNCILITYKAFNTVILVSFLIYEINIYKEMLNAIHIHTGMKN